MIARDARCVVGLVVFTLACGNAAEETSAPSVEASTQAPETPAPEASIEGATEESDEAAPAPHAEGDDTACVRAAPCCRAFVDAIGDESEANRARTACESLSLVEALGGAANDACANAIEGWRHALIARERDVPAACATSVQ